MKYVTDIRELEAIYGAPGAASLTKVASRLTPEYRKWIMASRFAVLSTVGPEGTDASPRGDDGPVVTELDAGTLAMPDWRGNNRMDSLRNIVADGRLSLMFMVPGSDTVVRVNGRGRMTLDADLIARFARDGRLPRSVLVIEIGAIYFQCARALMRSRLWLAGDESDGLPTAGQFLSAMTEGREGGAAYDATWPKRAAETLWSNDS